MVEPEHRRRGTSDYSLDAVHHWARRKQVIYASRKVQHDTENLGYSLDVVCQCLIGLQQQHFYESVCYDDKQGWLDVYRYNWCPQTNESASGSASGSLDPLYIKLKLNRDCTSIILASFHLDRFSTD